jgi:methionine sulfoxide reductase heme-binding subunit
MSVPSEDLFWITSRAAGTAALVLSSLTVSAGLTMGAKMLKRSGPDRRIIHETLSLSVMVAIAIHGLSLLGDKWLHPSLLQVTIPFLASYKTLTTSIGIVAGWAFVFLGLSYYLRRRIGQKRWQLIHRFTLLAWALGLVHAFTTGTDAGKTWFIALIVLTAAPALVLLPIRIASARRRGQGRTSQNAKPSRITTGPTATSIGRANTGPAWTKV